MAGRVYDILVTEVEKLLTKHVTLRKELLKMVEDVKELKQALMFYDTELMKKLEKKRIRLRL